MLKIMQWWVLQRKLHSSWLIAIVCVALLIGIVMTQWVVWTGDIGWICAALVVGLVVLWKRHMYLIPLLIVVGVVIGLWRGSVEQTQLTVYKNIYRTNVTLIAKVSDDPDSDKTGALILRLSEVSSSSHNLSGSVWVSTQTKFDIKRGDTVTVSGVLLNGFGNFAAVMYRASVEHVERPTPGDVARQTRDWFADAIRKAIPEPQASLGIGYLVGQRRTLPEDLSEALQVVGLTHIVVASGYNLTILVRLARRLFVKISKYLSALSASIMIVSFVAVTGASPSMSRAGLVCGLSLAAWYYGRSFHPMVLLCFAAAITVLIKPSYAWNDLGWQLSFAAFAGVMILAPLLQAYFYGNKKPGTVRQILGETISAHIVTLPILVLAFGQFSNAAIIANILVLPFVPIAMLLTFIAGAAGLIMPGISAIVGLPADILLRYMIWVAEYLASFPWAQSTAQIHVWIAVAAYVAIIGACMYLVHVTKLNLRDTSIVE